MDYLGMNPNAASKGGVETMTLAESYESLADRLKAIVESCKAVAGEPEVKNGYDTFGETWMTDVNQTAAHGKSVGGTTTITVSDGTGTDITNAADQSVTAPPVTPPGIG
ncbi:hypothetical protein [Glycomyces buryatensis]|uniref:Uncharacterized protein n=1 Tax=Glycomyces buryatensis TaxID=2570927 RepID=A0A4S8Q7C3_9ACTN|nr:hypothetical protein [Glycomyces buryatensis]THV40138.1 hypothetical protein FAB82_15685 [Glycomyces buryatensis]